MSIGDGTLLGFATALGCGLLIGIERERRKGSGPARALAGVRTFTLAALTGAVAQSLGQPLLVGVGGMLVLALAAIGYFYDRRRRDRSTDPGVTTELALFVTFLLGVTAIEPASLAAAGAVVVAMLLAARSELHRFSIEVLNAAELRDALLLAGAALIVLPLLPERPLEWLAGVDPHRLWGLVVLLMALQAAGYVALRIAGARLGLALSGLASGFVSSTATVATMGARARAEPRLMSACVAGALFSSVATPLQLALVAATISPATVPVMAPMLTAATLTAPAIALVSLRAPVRGIHARRPSGRAFSLRTALAFAALLTAATAAASFAAARYGSTAAAATAALAGLVDVHAAAASVFSLAAGDKIAPATVLLPVLIAFSTNTLSKLVAAWVAGGTRYALRVAAGLLVVMAAAWAPWLAAAREQ